MTKEELELENVRLKKEAAEKDALVEQLSAQLELMTGRFEELSEQLKKLETFQSAANERLSELESEIDN